MTERDYFKGADWTSEGRERTRRFEETYQCIQPFIEQTQRWKVGMRYLFCPEYWQITTREVKSLEKIGKTVGRVLQKEAQSPIGFRVDYIQDFDENYWITEVQTDDRGLPEMSILRNAYGSNGDFVGVAGSFLESVQKKFPNCKNVGIIFPDKEFFYYAPFYDFALMCRGEVEKPNICILRESEIIKPTLCFKAGKYPYDVVEIEVVYDFTQKFNDKSKSCFSPVGKDLLVKLIAASQNTIYPLSDRETLKSCVPPTFSEIPRNGTKKDNWVIKPIDGRWSKGVTFGQFTDDQKWRNAEEQVHSGKAVIQQFVMPKTEWFRVRTVKNNVASYPESAFLLRVEGYYFFDGKEYRLADIMITGTQNLPVHGRRDCIMVPAKISN